MDSQSTDRHLFRRFFCAWFQRWAKRDGAYYVDFGWHNADCLFLESVYADQRGTASCRAGSGDGAAINS